MPSSKQTLTGVMALVAQTSLGSFGFFLTQVSKTSFGNHSGCLSVTILVPQKEKNVNRTSESVNSETEKCDCFCENIPDAF